MGDGFTADPQAIRDFANQVSGFANELAQASGAAGTVLNENAIKVPKDLQWGTSTVAGQFDFAYGVICQPAGQIMQELQMQLIKSISGTLTLMQQMQRKLADNANNYQQVDEHNAAALKKSGRPVDVPGQAAHG
jgi:hypothetical protein